MSTTPICPCDAVSTPISNLPGLSQISFRAGDFNSFRRALLTPLQAPPGQPPLEQSLTAWKSGVGASPAVIDLAVMMVEWWAYLADILTFYNERIANEDYLRTAMLPETPAALIRLLGYRPRPAIGATGTLAALVAPSVYPTQTVTLPAGLQFQSKPGPGGPPQTFELSAATPIGLPDQVPAVPPGVLVEPGGNTLLLQGSVTSVSQGAVLLLGTRDDTTAPTMILLTAAPSVQPVAGGGRQTQLTFSVAAGALPALTAENARLRRANQSAALWTVNGSAIDSTGTVIQLAGLARQIRPGDWLAFTAPGQTSQLVKVQSIQDVLGDASATGSPTPPPPLRPWEILLGFGVTTNSNPIPVLHTQLTLQSSISALGNVQTSVSVLFGWVEIGTLVDQPPALWDGVSTSLQAVPPAAFPQAAPEAVLLQDSNGNGAYGTPAIASDGSLSVTWPLEIASLSPKFQPPIAILFNLLQVTCGKTVANEIVGSGNATLAGQSFTLANSPVTYLASGSSYASTIAITVNGQPWTEAASFYGQPANAHVFVTWEDANQVTHLDFGDGVNGARLPTGANNVVATYRFGAGVASPPAGKLTVIGQAYPGLKSLLNPVAAGGGSDADPASLLKTLAPRSVLTFGRAVSVFDYQAIAAAAPGVTMASVVWSWDQDNQQAAITIYVAGQNVAASVQTLLTASGDPNRPVSVQPATSLTVTLAISLIVTAGMDTATIIAGVQTALGDPQAGLFSPAGIGIGQGLFDSTIEAKVLAVSGVVAIQSSRFSVNGVVDPGPLHIPGEGNYYSLASGFLPTIGGTQ
jgi:hypothetical protein